MFHADPFSVALVLLGLPVLLWDGDAQSVAGRRLLRSAAFLLIVLGSSPLLSALMIGFLSLSARPACPLFWSLPVLALAALFPANTAVILGLLPVLLWPVIAGASSEPGPDERRHRTDDQGRALPVDGRGRSADVIGSLLALSALRHVAPSDMFPCALLIGTSAVLLSLRRVFRQDASEALVVLRPVLLFCVMQAARGVGVTVAVQAAAFALLLDLTLLVLISFPVFFMTSVLRLPVPPFAGFVVLWLGLHAVLSLSADLQGWSVAGVGVAVFLAFFSLLDGMTFLRLPHQKLGQSFAVAILLPFLVFLLANPVLRQMSGAWNWHFWNFAGGDGAELPLVSLWLLLGGIWLLLARPWSRAGERLPPAAAAPAMDALTVLPPLPRQGLRMMALGRRSFRFVKGNLPAGGRPACDMGVLFWLLFLGAVLVVLGLKA